MDLLILAAIGLATGYALWATRPRPSTQPTPHTHNFQPTSRELTAGQTIDVYRCPCGEIARRVVVE